MLYKALKMYFRHIKNHKAFTFITISGLIIGMAACILILIYVAHEKSYDTFHRHYDDLYRVQYNIYRDGELRVQCAAAVPAVGPAMVENFPEALAFTRAFPWSCVFTVGDNSIRQKKVQIVTPNFTTLLDFPIIRGDADSALVRPYTVVLCESMAKQLFGDEDPLGKTMRFNGEMDAEVTGICEDVPENSHIKFSALISFSSLVDFAGEAAETAWGWYDFNTYVLMQPGVDHEDFNRKFDAWLHDQENNPEIAERTEDMEFLLQPLKDIHLYSKLLQESEPDEQGDGQAVRLLTLVAVFILILAWINFINLSVTSALGRAREVGLRKVCGAERHVLIRQFIFESVVTNLIAMIVAVLAVGAILPWFRHLTGASLGFGLLFDSGYWLWLAILFIGGAILTNLYPAFVQSAFDPVIVLKGSFARSRSGSLMKKILVVFQFTVSAALIAGTIIVFLQMRHLENKDIGVDIDQVVAVMRPEVFSADSLAFSSFEAFSFDARQIPQIKDLALGNNVPGDEIFWANGSRRKDQDKEESKVMYLVGIDEFYVPFFRIPVIAGRNFDIEHFASDDTAAVINRAALEFYDFKSPEDAVGEMIIQGGNTREIIGVIENYNQMSPKGPVTPLLFVFRKDSRNYHLFRIHGQDVRGTLSRIRTLWEKHYPGNPFEYFFLDEFFNRQYEKDRQFGLVFGVFAGLAIFVSILGLVALTAYSNIQRSKEIAVRKVHGARFWRLLMMVMKEQIQWVVLANILAVPIAWFGMEQWLRNFEWRITIQPWIFVLVFVITILIAVLTTLYYTIGTVRRNPADILRFE